MGIAGKEFQGNLIVNRIMGSWNDAMSDISIHKLYETGNLVLIRSAREEVMYSLLEQLNACNYAGNLHLIGRQGDEKYILEYPGMDIDLFVVDDCEKYSVENTEAYINRIQIDAVCFLYQSSISFNHDNLLQIIDRAGCHGYAVSRDLQAVKFNMDKLHDYLRGKAVYDELCSWLYDSN